MMPLPALPQAKTDMPMRIPRFLRVMIALMLREMSTRYGRNPGGYLWALLEPLGGITVMAIGFSLIVHRPPLGTSFMLFYATGLAPFGMFQNISNNTAKALRYSRPLLAYPSVTWLDAVLARFVLNTLTGMTVNYILLTAILMVSDTRSTLDIWPILTSMGMAALLGLAVGSINAVLIGFFPLGK